MNIFRELKKRKDIALLVEEKLYEYVSQEILAGNIRQGLWAKACVEADSGSDSDIQRKYIGLRVEMLRVEERLLRQFFDEVLNQSSTAIEVSPAPSKREIRIAIEKAKRAPGWLGRR